MSNDSTAALHYWRVGREHAADSQTLEQQRQAVLATAEALGLHAVQWTDDAELTAWRRGEVQS